MERVDGNSDNLLVQTGLVFHQQRSHRTAADHGAGCDRNGRDHQYVARISVL